MTNAARWWLRTLALIGVCLLAPGVSTGCGGDGGGGDGGGTITADGSSSGCRFSQAACSSCIATRCAAESDDCYGAGWTAEDLCSTSGASASCTDVSSASEGLQKQTAYATCVAGSCTSDCQ